jgi:cytochrome bd ubiquinol oxidase subunit I
MDYALGLHRFHFAFTITFHYIFVQLSLGLSFMIFLLKTLHLRTGQAHYNQAARFWARIFAVNFALGVVTGIPMEFQFGTNWSRFSQSAGSVIGQTLAMEGLYSFFLESAFLGLLIYGEKIMGRVGHWGAALAMWIGTWASGYLIVITNAWMQHPVGYTRTASGAIELSSWTQLLFNTWGTWQYLHVIMGGVITGGAALAALGAFYHLLGRQPEFSATNLRLGVVAAFLGCALSLFPTGDQQGLMVARHQPATLAAMEGHFETGQGDMVILGQPDVESRRIDNVVSIPRVLSFLTYKRWDAELKGLDQVPRDQWPDHLPLVFYAFHIMVGLGTLMVALFGLSLLQLWRGRLLRTKPLLWALMLAFPFPFIANTAGWMTAELGRQPWLIYGLMRTADGSSPQVSSGSAMFSLLGFMGLYALLAMLGLFLIWREIEHGPGETTP